MYILRAIVICDYILNRMAHVYDRYDTTPKRSYRGTYHRIDIPTRYAIWQLLRGE